MTDTTLQYHPMLQPTHGTHPLSTAIPPSAIHLNPQQQQRQEQQQPQQQQQQHSSAPRSSGTPSVMVQDSPTTSVDFNTNNSLFATSYGRISSHDDFEDLDYQSGMTNYPKHHLGSRHLSLPESNTLDIHPHTAAVTPSNIPIQSMKHESSFYASVHDDYNTLPYFSMSAPANIAQFNAPSPPLHFLHGADVTTGGLPMPTTTAPSSSFFVHQQPSYYQQSYQQMDSPGSVAKSYEDDDYNIQMNMQMIVDKRRRRRESHNAVERRRRENINDRIQELGTLLPETASESSVNSKPNKGAILRHSVDHIRHLQHEVNTYSQRVKELEAALAKLQSK